MPASHPFIDTWAPAQYVFGNTGGAGPLMGDVNVGAQNTFDTTLHYKVGGTVLLALVGVFLLRFMGFRFVVAAGVGGR